MTPASRDRGYVAVDSQRTRPMNDKQQPDKQQGIKESQQDRQQDEVAKQRPGQADQKVHDAETRRPPRKDNAS